MQDSLAECVFHLPHVLCKRELQPFTIWHAFLLDFAQSPFIGAGPGRGSASDLALAIEICSRAPSSPAKSPRWDITPSETLIQLIYEIGLERAAASFRAYLTDYIALPACWESATGQPVKSNVALYTVAVLIRHGRRTEEEAWATQFGYARHLTLALAEAAGNEISLISPAELAAMKEAAEGGSGEVSVKLESGSGKFQNTQSSDPSSLQPSAFPPPPSK